LYGLNSRKVHEAIHYIIYQIKKYNLMRYKEQNENEQEVDGNFINNEESIVDE
jgi:hypothetical protein